MADFKKMMPTELVNIQHINSKIIVDLKYATADNLAGRAVYSFKGCYLIPKAATALGQIADLAWALGYQLKVWDGFRPMSVQEIFWQVCPDPRYVSNPKEGGRHTRGTAVDLTLVKDGKEVAMPSAFDENSKRAHRDYQDATCEQIAHRQLLTGLMMPHFEGFETEWWHYDLMGWQNYPPLPIEGHQIF